MIPPSPTSEVSSQCAAITPSDAEDSVNGSSVDDSGSMMEVESKSEADTEH